MRLATLQVEADYVECQRYQHRNCPELLPDAGDAQVNARTIGDFTSALFNQAAPAGGTKLRRSGQPVRRNSYQAGERERDLWQPLEKGAHRRARRVIGARIRAIKQYDRHHRKTGEPMGPIGYIGIDVYECMQLCFLDFATGRCEPAIDTIASKLRRSRKAIVAALARLRDHGFLKWIRRTVKVTENEGSFAPQVKQISNAYGFRLPSFAQSIVDKILGHSPAPDDAVARRAQHHAETEAMYATLGSEEFVEAALEVKGELAKALRSLGRARDNANSLGGQNPGFEG